MRVFPQAVKADIDLMALSARLKPCTCYKAIGFSEVNMLKKVVVFLGFMLAAASGEMQRLNAQTVTVEFDGCIGWTKIDSTLQLGFQGPF
jgi:hypothetical protein